MEITCGCDGNSYNYESQKQHYSSTSHMEWFNADPEEHINQIFIQCGCGTHYNYKNGHNHFKSKPHRDWEMLDSKRHDNVLIVCKCGDVIKYGDRQSHNKTH